MRKLAVSSLVGLLIVGGGFLVYSASDSIGTPVDSSQTSNTAKLVMIESIPKSKTEKLLETYVGDEHDRFFIANMIAHHQGAVDMANLALASAKHAELKTMAKAIISSQNTEINNMLSWQKAWGYPETRGEMMVDHSGMNMMGDMETMTAELKSLNGEAFDKKFIELMIEHHQSAVSMARPGAKNAGHQEVKDLTKAIIDAQSSEISQMQQWQKDWGY